MAAKFRYVDPERGIDKEILPQPSPTGGLTTRAFSRPEEVEKDILDNMIPPGDLKYFKGSALPMMKANSSKGPTLNGLDDWVRYRDTLKMLPAQERSNFTRYALPNLIHDHGLKEGGRWELFSNSLSHIPAEARADYSRHVLSHLLQKGLVASDEEWGRQASQYGTLAKGAATQRLLEFTREGLPAMIAADGFTWEKAAEMLKRG